MRIKTIKLNNFQAHSKRRIELSPGITTIKGATDKGKSAILRALGWCCLNNVPGDEFIKEGEKKATVTITTETQDDFGEKIERTRSAGGSINTYEMGEQTYRAFGQGVPDDISKHLALSPINFQGQHDSPFWFSETAGEVSRRLNAVIDLSVIDSSLSAVAQEVRKNQDKKTLCEERLQSVVKELEIINPQRERIREFKRLEKLKEKSDEHTNHFNQLDRLIKTIRANPAKQFEARHTDAVEVFSLAKKATTLTNQKSTLADLIQKAERYQSKSKPPPDETEIDKKFNRLQDICQQIINLKDNILRLEQNKSKVETIETELKEAETTFHEQTKGANCPLCGNLIK